MAKCPCGSNHEYEECCGQYIEKGEVAPTPEALMRSRYTAFTQANTDYVGSTMMGQAARDYDVNATKQWCENCEWLGLQIIKTKNESDDLGFVEFIAKFKYDGRKQEIHENSEFHKIDGRWVYVDGQNIKVGRNDPCPCGSGKKYKKCCLMGIAETDQQDDVPM